MNDELKKQLAAMLAQLSTAAQEGAAWTANQIPPLVREKILYGRISNTMWCLLGVIGVILSYRICKRSWPEDDDDRRYDMWIKRKGAGMCITCFIVGALSLCFVLFAGDEALEAWFAPRLYIVEWLSGLLGRH